MHTPYVIRGNGQPDGTAPSGSIATDRSGILHPVLFHFPDSLFCMDWCRHFLVSFCIVRAPGSAICIGRTVQCPSPAVPASAIRIFIDCSKRDRGSSSAQAGFRRWRFITVNAPLARTCVPGIASVSSATRALATKRRSAKCGGLLPASRLMGSDGLDG
jgi:hypothetical protein